MWPKIALLGLVLFTGVVVLHESTPQSAALLAARSAAAEEAWLAALEQGSLLHVVDDVYQPGSVHSSSDSSGSFVLPESFTQELWVQYEGTSPAIFCSIVSVGSTLLQTSSLDKASGELVLRDSATGAERRIPRGVYPLPTLRESSLAVTSRIETVDATVIESDTSLARAATVLVIGGDSREERLYADPNTGKRFASEVWDTSDAEPVLTRRLMRDVRIDDASTPCEFRG